MSLDLLWAALALMLVLEGLMPLLGPDRWRALFLRMTELSNGQLRFIGLVCVLAGLLTLALMQ